jgi:nucleoside-diphosphate-sugar epimerase
MRVLVIGGTGFIGPHVVRRLHALGHEITLFHRGRTAAEVPPGVTHVLGDRADLLGSVPRFKGLAPDVVLDMFPYGEDDARLVTTAFGSIARRVVALSSMDVYRAYDRLHGREPDPPDPVPLTEEAPLRRKLYPYGGTYEKILVEQVVMGNPGLPGTILRLPMVHGPGDGQHRLFVYLKRMDDHRPAILLDVGMARWQATRGYVENVAAAVALAVFDDRAGGRVYNVGEARPQAEADWVRAIGRAAGWQGEVVVVPRERLPVALRWWGDANTGQQWAVDTTRIREELGCVEHVPEDVALERTVAWERAHPPESVDPAQFDYAAEDNLLASVRAGPL